MKPNDSGEWIEFPLVREEHDYLVRDALSLNPEIVRKLLFGEIVASEVRFRLAPGDFSDLLDAVAAEINHAPSSQVATMLDGLYDRLCDVEDRFMRQRGQLDPVDCMSDPTGDIREEIDRFWATHQFDSIHEANEALARLCTQLNQTPRAEYHGLSPEQVVRLVDVPWDSPEFLIAFNENLAPEDLKGARLLTNTVRFLHAVKDSEGIKATAKGNLPMAFVTRMMEELSWKPGYIEIVRKVGKRFTEMDLWSLHCLRVVLGQAGLLRRRDGYFRCSKKAIPLMKTENLGGLYALLFRTWFQTFELSYRYRGPECDDLQDTIAYSFVIVGRLARDWKEIRILGPELVLPAVRETIPSSPYCDLVENAARHYILESLHEFGLIEFRGDTPGDKIHLYTHARVTPLYDKFFRFRG